eukprot:CAMPEP_0184314920 /NCGR_PEP_ID=MMETSP1049-20130417/78541_1 /TAXON_ID=77928 /ORGANISM="Proteomonas sulcata, Strain CCMP704" /LENGTH=54 /DNA_ID=CAMNT_0026633125 /DNA_START=84 /DNA_END=244 /DNA_ORIENTATION=-
MKVVLCMCDYPSPELNSLDPQPLTPQVSQRSSAPQPFTSVNRGSPALQPLSPSA